MRSKNIFSLFLILIFVLSSCGQETTTRLPVTQTPIATQPSTDIPTQTAIPTSIPLVPIFPPSPTAVPPYPTASVVKANAVAFIEGNFLWIANVDGSGERKLADMIRNKSWVYDQMLQWSPDGTWISYFSKDEVWIVSPDGWTNKKFLSLPNLYTYIWSPDGQQIAYIQTIPRAVSSIVVGILDLATGEISEISSHEASDPMPISWSPDGKYILFTKNYAFVMFDVNTHKIVKEIKTGGNGCGLGWNTWSPNNKWFSHSYHGTGSYSPNWTCVSGLNGLTWKIENTSDTSSGGIWDKTGNFLYFITAKFDPSSEQQLMRYDVITKKMEKLLSLNGGEKQRMWSVSISPNGNIILLRTCTVSSNQCLLVVMDAQSLSIINKYTVEFETSSEIEEYYPYPAWSPDNQYLIVFVWSSHVSHAYGSFYALDIKTGKAIVISGNHHVENGAVSPITTTP